jgi:hypothetical protein
VRAADGRNGFERDNRPAMQCGKTEREKTVNTPPWFENSPASPIAPIAPIAPRPAVGSSAKPMLKPS